MKHTLLLAAVLLSVSLVQAQAKIPPDGDSNGAAAIAALKASPRHGEWVDVEMPGSATKIKTWVVYPEKPGKVGVVLVIHEIFGMTDWVRGVADQLAADGYIAVAPDFLSGKGPNGGASDSLNGNVGPVIRTVTPDDQVKILDACREYALKMPACNGKIGCVGFCWGGTASFNYAIKQPKLNAAAAYYGTAPMKDAQNADKDALAKIECPVLGCYGASDGRVTATVEPTKKAMEDLKKSYMPNVYEGAGHGFLRQHASTTGEPNQANIKASQQAWPTTIAFFKKNLE